MTVRQSNKLGTAAPQAAPIRTRLQGAREPCRPPTLAKPFRAPPAIQPLGPARPVWDKRTWLQRAEPSRKSMPAAPEAASRIAGRTSAGSEWHRRPPPSRWRDGHQILGRHRSEMLRILLRDLPGRRTSRSPGEQPHYRELDLPCGMKISLPGAGFLVLLFLQPRGRKPLCGLAGKPSRCSVSRVLRSLGQFPNGGDPNWQRKCPAPSR